MALRPQFTKKDIRDFIRSRVEVIDGVVKDQLLDAAEQFVADARSVDTYKDRTGNLRGSIGYTLYKDGNEVFGNFEGASDGGKIAQRLIKGIKADYPRGYALIVVAGMNYAAYVEAKGYDVVTGSSQTAESDLERQFDKLKQRLANVR
jgi:hypothetical protein